MSRIFEALQQSTREAGLQSPVASVPAKLADIMPRVGDAQRPPQVFSLPMSLEKRLVAVTDRLGFGTEKLRMLSARLKYIQHRGALKRLLITSTVVGEGKTTITANLGVILAQQQQRVLLIDGDLHQSALTALFGLGSRPGLGDWWHRQQEIDDFIYCTEGIPLWCLPSGKAVDQPLAMLHSGEFQQLIERIGHRYDWIIIDSPPLAPLADAATWATMADGVVLIARRAVTPKKLLEQSFTQLDRGKIVGVVFNGAESDEQRYYARYYDHSGRRPPNSPPKAAKK